MSLDRIEKAQRSDSCNIVNDLFSSTVKTNSNLLLSQLTKIRLTDNKKNKLAKIKQLKQSIRQISKNDAHSVINSEFCIQLYAQINNGQIDIEQELLGIVREIAELGLNFAEPTEQNYFFIVLSSSRLMNRVQSQLNSEMINKRIFKDSEKCSNFIVLLTQTFSFIMKNQSIKSDPLLSFIGKIIIYSINSTSFKMKEYSQQYQNKFNLPQFEILIKKIQQYMVVGIRTLKALKFFAQLCGNRDYVIKSLNITNAFSSLIHFNCPPNINCPICVQIPESRIFLQLRSTLFSVIAQYIVDDKFKDYLLKSHLIFEHLCQIIISQPIDQQKQIISPNQTNHMLFMSSSSSQSNSMHESSIEIISESLHILFIIIQNNPFYSQKLVHSNGLVETLINLTHFNKNILQSQSLNNEAIKIRLWSNSCIQKAINYSDEKVMNMLLVDLNIIRSLIESLSNCNGINQMNNQEKLDIILIIKNIYANLIQGTEYFTPNPKLLKGSLENFEEEGGMEEIESKANNLKVQYIQISIMSYTLVSIIINVSKDKH